MPLRRLLRTRPSSSDIDAELLDHLARLADDLQLQGMKPEEARRQARLMVGGSLSLREQCREARARAIVDRGIRWARDVCRALRRDPLVTGVCIVTLALGIGAVTAMATVTHTLLIEPLPYPGADRLMEVWTVDANDGRTLRPGVDGLNLDALREATADVFSDVEGYRYGSVTMTGLDVPVTLSAPMVSPGLLSMLSVVPHLGRLLDERDTPETRHVVISEALWRTRFDSSRSIVGRTVTLDDESHVIVGVLPRHVQFPWQPAMLWRPLDDRAPGRTYAVGVVRDTLTVPARDARLDARSTHLQQQGVLEAGTRIGMQPTVQARMGSRHKTALLATTAATTLVLAIALVNVASLLLARSAARHGETAMRAALGASRLTLTTRLLGEVLAIVGIGAVAGAVVARVALTVLLHQAPDELRHSGFIAADTASILPWAILATAISAIAICLLSLVKPDLITPREGLSSLSSGARVGSTTRYQSALVVCQVALLAIVMVGAGLLLRSAVRLYSVDPGFGIDGIHVVSMDLPRHRYGDGPTRLAFMHGLKERLAALGSVSEVALAESAPPSGGSFAVEAEIEIDGRPRGTVRELPLVTVTPEYFATIGISLVEGTTFGATPDGPVVIVSRAVAARYWQGESPIGRTFRWSAQLPPYRVVGVAADAKHGGLDDALGQGMAVYLPFGSDPWPFFSVLLRSSGQGPSDAEVRAVLHGMDPRLPYTFETMRERLWTSIERQRYFSLIAVVFAVTAAVLAAVGLLGNAIYWTVNRQRELALRLAVGASRHDIERHVLLRSLRLALLGGALGLVGALTVAGLLEPLLFGVTRHDPWTIVGVVTTLGALVVAAVFVPARRASRLDPWRILQG